VVGAGQPYSTIQAAVDAAPEGAVIYIRNGVYRESVSPKTRQTLQGESRDGTRIDGADAVSPAWWHPDGSLWYFTDPWPLVGTSQGSWNGVSADIDAMSNDLLHRDDLPLLHKMTRAEVGSGDFWVDYRTRRVYVADDPAGHRFELAVRREGVGTGDSSVTGVTLQNLTVEKTASVFNEAAVEMGPGWTVQDCLVLGSHGRGINTSVNNRIIGTIAPTVGRYPGGGARTSAQQGRAGSMQVMLTGSLGIGGDPNLDGGQDNQVQITNTEIGWSNSERFSYWDEAGGVKLSLRQDVRLTGDWIHDSYGPGVWFDTNNRAVQIQGNLMEDNLAAGVWYEANPGASNSGVQISNNTFRRNGNTAMAMNRAFDLSGQYAAVFLSDSAHAEVGNNFIQVGTRGGFGIADHYGGRVQPADFQIHDNVISIGIPTAAFAFGTDGPGITFRHDTVLTWGQVDPLSSLFSLGADNFAAWQAAGRDRDGTIAAVAAPGS
jgi:hypothetical protein